jgi:CHAD domain-containing protein
MTTVTKPSKLDTPRSGHHRDRTAQAAVREILCECSTNLEDSITALRVEVSRHAVHHARTGIRRAQSALGLGEKVFAAGSVDELRHELGWLMDALGILRDLDVLVLRLRDFDADTELIAEFARERGEAEAQLRVILESVRCDRLVEMLRQTAQDPPTMPSADTNARRRFRPIVRRRWRKLTKAVDALGSHPTTAQLHHVRILAKRCRYTCEICEREFGAPARTMARRLRTVQDELGALHDTDVLVSRLREVGVRRPALAFSAGEAAGIAETRDRNNAARGQRAWQRLDRPDVTGWL